MKPFPMIEGVSFQLIPNYTGYAISSDRKMWIGRSGKWRRMETYAFCDGREAIWLLSDNFGGSVHFIDELMKNFA